MGSSRFILALVEVYIGGVDLFVWLQILQLPDSPKS